MVRTVSALLQVLLKYSTIAASRNSMLKTPTKQLWEKHEMRSFIDITSKVSQRKLSHEHVCGGGLNICIPDMVS